MKPSSQRVYPISYKFEMFLVDNNLLRYTHTTAEGATEPSDDVMWLQNEAPGPMDAILVSTAKTMLETLGEYEHGTAEISALFDEVSVEIKVPGTNRSMSGWSSLEDGTTEEQSNFIEKVEKAMLINLCGIYSDLLLIMIAGGPSQPTIKY